MEMRDVYGSVLDIDGTANPGDEITFRLERVGFDLFSHYMPSDKVAIIGADGTVPETSLWASAGGGRNILCIMPNGYTWRFRLEPGDDPISLEVLHTLYAPPEPAWPQTLYEILRSLLGSTLIGWANSGVGAILRTISDKLRDTKSTSDYDTFANALAAAAGKTLIVNTAVTVSANTTVPADVALRFDRNGSISPGSGFTVFINGPMTAGRFPIFGGLGTIAGTPKCDEAYPEWFGATATDTTGNTDAIAFQKAVDFHLVVRGDPNVRYIINTMRVLYDARDMHDIGHGLTAQMFVGGYWCGFMVTRSGARLLDCVFEMTGEVQASNNLKAKHAVGIGVVGGARTLDIRMERCRFSLHANMQTNTGVALLGGRPRGFVACSVDGLTIVNNRFIGPAIDVPPRQNNIIGGYIFDSTGIRFSDNYLENGNFFAAMEYCMGIVASDNIAVQSWQFFDFDKICREITVANNKFKRSENWTTSSDPVLEFNACAGVAVLGNTATYARTWTVVNGKDELYLTWVLALANADLNTRQYVSWERHTFEGNVVEYTGLQAVIVGNTWETDDGSPRHVGVLPGNGLVIKDYFWMCGTGLGSDEKHSVIQISEGTRIVIESIIDGDPAVYTTLLADVLEGATSISVASTAGFTDRTPFSVILQTDDDHSKTHHVAAVSGSPVGSVVTFAPAFPVTDPDSGNTPIVPIATAGTLVRIGGMGGFGVGGRSFVDGDTWTVTHADGSTTLYTVAGGTLWSDLDITIRDSFFRNVAWNAINLSRMSSLTVENVRIVDCGKHQSNPQQILITQPEARAARIHLSDLNVYVKSLAVANGLQFNSKNFRAAGLWRAWLRSVHVEGHTKDLFLRDNNTGVFTPTESLENFSIDDTCVMPNSNINSVTAVGWRRRTVITASAVPTGTDARDAWMEVGTILEIYPPVAGQPVEYELVDATAKPFVWKVRATLQA